MTEPIAPLRIDIISDVVCPWCIVGFRQLSEALAATQTPHQIYWHPFELNQNMGAEGENLAKHIMQKYGSSPVQSAQSREQLTSIGAGLGFAFNFTDDMRMHNTFQAHQLLQWADEHGRKGDLKLALFSAHFTDRRNLSDRTVLADIAAEVGLDRVEAVAALDEQRFAGDVRAQEQFWYQQGISGVPAVIFDSQHLVTGAQGTETYTSILTQLAEMRQKVAVS